jgi:phospholipid transport system substrate-binding protein
MKNYYSLHTLLYLLIIGLCFPISAFSQSTNNNNSPQQLIKTMSEQFENEIITHQQEIKKNPAITDDLITKHLVSNVNFLLMSRYVLGKNWKKAATEQKDEFAQLFESLLIRFYSKAFIEYLKKNHIEKGMISYLPFRAKSGSKYAKVKTEIKVNPETPKIQVNYSLYQGKTKGWKIYDISIEGISLVTSYRSSFNDIIKKESMAGLINHLRKKVKR